MDKFNEWMMVLPPDEDSGLSRRVLHTYLYIYIYPSEAPTPWRTKGGLESDIVGQLRCKFGASWGE